MSSRLKGRGKKKKKPSWRVHKLVVYGVLILVTIAILWYLYLWEWNPDRVAPDKQDDQATESTSGSVPDDAPDVSSSGTEPDAETSGTTGGKKP
jgi:cytoskeletal protein RodZ